MLGVRYRLMMGLEGMVGLVLVGGKHGEEREKRPSIISVMQI
jgi:hypothetical protein